MFKKWDVIIVGAGIGGLTAATMLVKAGLRVLVLERSPHPGGTAYVYKRQGFTFPMGPLGFSTPSLVLKTLNSLDGRDLKLSQIQYRIKAFDLDIPISLPFPKMIRELVAHFPTEDKGVKQFFKDMEEMIFAIQFPDHGLNRSILEKAAKMSARDYLTGLVNDWRLRRVLGTQGTQEPYSSLPLLAATWNLMSNEGVWYPEGGMSSLCERLVQTIIGPQENHGGFGEIKLGAEVKEIRVEKGGVLGVTLKDEREVDTDAVISNADYKTTFMRLVDPDALPVGWYQAVVASKQTRSILQVCLGVDTKKVDLFSFENDDRLIYRRNRRDMLEDVDWSANEIETENLAGQECEVSLLSKNDKMLCPEGTEVIVIRTEAEHSHFKRFRPSWRKRVSDYQDYKIRLGKALVQEVENIIPGLGKAAFIMDVATPLTFEEQGGRSEGAVAGWSWNYEDCPDYRPRECVRTPVKGLYMAGYQGLSTIFMGGIPTAMESGKRAAQAVLQGAGPLKEIAIPVTK